jgi:hypothetical protein
MLSVRSDAVEFGLIFKMKVISGIGLNEPYETACDVKRNKFPILLPFFSELGILLAKRLHQLLQLLGVLFVSGG